MDVDADAVVAEIVSFLAEVDMVVGASPMEDVVVTIMLLTLLFLLLVLLPLLKDVVLPDIRLINLLQVVVVNRVVMLFIIPAVTIILLVCNGAGKAMVLSVKAVVDLPLILLIMQTSVIMALLLPWLIVLLQQCSWESGEVRDPVARKRERGETELQSGKSLNCLCLSHC